jgi:predicted nucleotide-binding protein
MLYHVWILLTSDPTNMEVRYNLTFEQLTDCILSPYYDGDPFVIFGRTIIPTDILRIRITQSEVDAAAIYNTILEEKKRKYPKSPVLWTTQNWEVLQRTVDVTNTLITRPPGQKVTSTAEDIEQPSNRDPKAVFVVHGRDLRVRDAMFSFLRSLELHPIEWSVALQATGRPTPYVANILEQGFKAAQAFVILLTPDDEGQLREELRNATDPPHETTLTPQARQNVVFEAGMALGRHPERTVLVEFGTLRPFSDIAGLHVVRMNNSSQRRQELANRLKLAGCLVNLEGTDWHSAGDFDLCSV